MMHLYMGYALAMFYLKINSTLYRTLISFKNYQKVEETRAKDIKLKAKEKAEVQRFSTLAVLSNRREKKWKNVDGESAPIRSA